MPLAQINTAALKERLADVVSIPAARQRLIHKGRVLREEQTLQDIGAAASSCVPLRLTCWVEPHPNSRTVL